MISLLGNLESWRLGGNTTAHDLRQTAPLADVDKIAAVVKAQQHY